MKCKKFVAMGMAAVTALSLGVPAFAANTVITGTYNEIKIDVEIPTTGEAVINPYAMPVKAKYKPTTGEPEELGALTTAGKIATQPLIGVSTCEVALDVGATVTAVPKGDLMLANKDISTARTKSALVYLECKQDTTLTNAMVTTDASKKPISGIEGTKAVDAFNAWESSTYSFDSNADTAAAANSDKVLASEAGSTKLNLCTLTAAKMNNTTKKMEPQTGSFLLARLGGDVVQNPTDPWTSRDGVTVTVAFTFVPAAPKQTGDITLKVNSIGTGPKLQVVKPDGTAFSADAEYTWVVVDAGDSGVAKITATGVPQDEDGATAKLVAAKDFTVKVTVKDGGITYVSDTSDALQLAA